VGAQRLDHGGSLPAQPAKKKGGSAAALGVAPLPDGKGHGRGDSNGSRTALRGAVSGRSVFNETARPASPAWRAALACRHRSGGARLLAFPMSCGLTRITGPAFAIVRPLELPCTLGLIEPQEAFRVGSEARQAAEGRQACRQARCEDG
jgi:hypothetical protein